MRILPVTVTVVFMVYALAVLTALLTFGSLSDHGRAPSGPAGAIALQAATMIVFATATGVPELLVARIVQGLATGAGVGVLGAGLLDLNKTGGPSPTRGRPLGNGHRCPALESPRPVPAVARPPGLSGAVRDLSPPGRRRGPDGRDIVAPSRGLASLRPPSTLPASACRPFLLAVLVLIAVCGPRGLLRLSALPLVRQVVGSNSFIFGRLALTLLAGAAAVSVLVARDAPPRAVMILGSLALTVEVAITLMALALSSPVVFFVGTAVAGVALGGGFQGAPRTVLPLAGPHQRAGVHSGLYVVCGVAMGGPGADRRIPGRPCRGPGRRWPLRPGGHRPGRPGPARYRRTTSGATVHSDRRPGVCVLDVGGRQSPSGRLNGITDRRSPQR